MSILDSTRRSWYSSAMILALLLVAFVFGVNHSIRRTAAGKVIPLARYSCDSCGHDYLLPFSPQGVPCPTCTPLFDRLERTTEWTP